MDLVYLSKTKGIGGNIKNTPEDFIVEEIMEDGTLLEKDKKITREQGSEGGGEFTHFILQKTNWNTFDALREIGKRLKCSLKSFGYAGTKDRNAITTQLASVYQKEVNSVKIKDMRILGSWKAEKKVSLGDLMGNRFTIRVKTGKRKTEDVVHSIYEEMAGMFPNYFGPQRFGMRRNTHVVGKNMLVGSFRRACEEYLFGGEKETNESARNARENLKNTGDYKKALTEYPKHLFYERTLIGHLVKNPNDYVNAMRKLPRGLSLMFIHAYQAYLFNRILSIKTDVGGGADIGEYYCGENAYGFADINHRTSMGFLVGKLPGYESEIGEVEKEILAEEGIRPVDFKMRSFPEISSKGGYRVMYCPIKDFEFSEENCEFRFALPSGSYATMVIREFTDEDKGEPTQDE